MKNALILHGTDFAKEQKQAANNWFPWLKKKLETGGSEPFRVGERNFRHGKV